MNIKNILYLGSNSYFRKMLLTESKIPFVVVGHTADEESVNASLSLEEQVRYVSQLKMNHIAIPAGTYEGQISYLLTADTMRADEKYGVHSKPLNLEDAYEKIRSLTGTQKTATGFCIAKKIWKNGEWKIEKEINDVVVATFKFKVPEFRLKDYFENTPALEAAGAMMTENYGMQFLHSINGSHSTIVGLPLFEVRTILEDWGFYE